MIKSLQVLNPTMTPHRFPVTELASSSLPCFLFQDLDLSRNKISKIHRHAFNKLLKLKVLNLQGNSLTTISFNWFPSSQFPDSLSAFNLNHNPWTCDCEMKDFANISRNNSLTSSLHITCM
ncbi:leucine-rich repeat-containing protein 66-like [Clavelina lepadiformis]|uniref:leucine-rich repeat-containing protein 66-like n=1 Tax=Clavelina lepadiformis TaxID=159417 RepID=UPI0040430384